MLHVAHEDKGLHAYDYSAAYFVIWLAIGYATCNELCKVLDHAMLYNHDICFLILHHVLCVPIDPGTSIVSTEISNFGI